MRRLNAEYDCQFKFVVGSLADCEEVIAYLADFPEIDRTRILLMPMGTQAAELAAKQQWLAPYCEEHGLTFCPRRHIEWFGCRRGT
jgi:7-carboxy-7-deazaguanine synthase